MGRCVIVKTMASSAHGKDKAPSIAELEIQSHTPTRTIICSTVILIRSAPSMAGTMAQTKATISLQRAEKGACSCCKCKCSCSYCDEKDDEQVVQIQPLGAQKVDPFSVNHCCTQLCRTARSLWLLVGSGDDSTETMKSVEQLYSHVWFRRRRVGETNDDVASSSKRARLEDAHVKVSNLQESKDSAINVVCCPDQCQLAGEKLSLIYLQSGRALEADRILENLGYKCRLARNILDYTSETTLETGIGSGSTTGGDASVIPCCIYDDFLGPGELNVLQTVFSDPFNSYWTDHNYTVEPPSPYFSYLLPLPQSKKNVPRNKEGLQQIVCRVRNFLAQHHAVQFPNVNRAEYVEIWAHNRPHTTGHQFHFDSDNEGCAGDEDSNNANSRFSIRNPICSCVLFLSGDEDAVGGPSVVTNQRLASRHLATKAWMCPAKSNRLLAFDGKVLHGVVPGKAFAVSDSSKLESRRRRVTVMLAFWRRIRVRNLPSPGAARLLPTEAPWAQQLRTSLSDDDDGGATSSIAKQPIPIHTVYESVPEGNPWKRNQGMPDYEQMFQGF